MRAIRLLYRPALIAPSPVVLEPHTAAMAASSSVPDATATKLRRAFAPLHIHLWQKHCLGGAAGAELLPPALLHHGAHLGPRPLVILDHTARGDPAAAAAKFEAMLSNLSWEHGAVYVPLHADYTNASQDVLGRSCQQVCAVLDVLDVRWTHFLTYSYGSLVAARMAASDEFPHRIGTITSLDTPLVTRELVRNMQQREEIALAQRDVNVPGADLTFAKETLLASLEGPLPCPSDADAGIYAEYLFDPRSVFAANGLTRHEERYVSLRRLTDMRHPLQFIVPVEGSVADAAVHKDVFGLRRPAVVKNCKSHAELFGDAAAKEIGGMLNAWLQRFEPDTFIARRYEQAAKEMTQLMSAAQPTPQAPVADSGEQRKKKKEKKKD